MPTPSSNFSPSRKRESLPYSTCATKCREEGAQERQSNLELMKRGRTIIILSAVGTIFLIICVAGLFYHRNKMNDYKQIVAVILPMQNPERHLREQLRGGKGHKCRGEDRSGAKTTRNRKTFFEQLEKMMKDDWTYRDVALARQDRHPLLHQPHISLACS